MKDLYRRLGVDGPRDSLGLEDALRERRGTQEDLAISGYLFAAPSRRQVYEHAWRSLVLIADFRVRLALQYSESWSRGEMYDFSGRQMSTDTRRQVLPYDGTPINSDSPAHRSDFPSPFDDPPLPSGSS